MLRITGPLWGESVTNESLHKGPVMWRMLTCHSVKPCLHWDMNITTVSSHNTAKYNPILHTVRLVNRAIMGLHYTNPPLSMTSSNGKISALLDLCEGNHRSPVDSPHKGQWRGTLKFSLVCAWTNGWANNGNAGDLRRPRPHYDVIVMCYRYHCPACRTTLVATRFRVAVICPIIQVPHCIRVFFDFVWFVFINHIFQFYYELCTYCNILDIYLS